MDALLEKLVEENRPFTREGRVDVYKRQGQREATLLRCAQAIAGRQQDFFRSGPSALRPLRLSDIAQELEIHESTVSRAIRDKYVQCPRGVFPLRHFLSRRAAGESGAEVGSCAAKELLRRLIREEDSTKPHSDQ